MSSGALAGIKVLDLSRVLAGPFCTMVLGDLGAEVIKVEAPGGSDDTRAWGPPYQNNISAYYLCTNRNKQSLTINLKEEKGRQILKELIQTSDVVIHNFKTGTMEKWGLDYKTLSEVNPALIYCSISGFGQTGPYKSQPGYDFVIQAMSGLMSITGSTASGPIKVGVAITDVLTGLYANIAIQASLIERERSGKGQEIDISLLDSAIASLVNIASNYLISGDTPSLLGNYHPNIAPYQTFPTADGEMVIAVGNDRQFKSLCHTLGVGELGEDERFSTNPNRVANREVLEKLLNDQLCQKTSSEWTNALLQAGIPCGPINNLKVVFEDEQVKARNLVRKIEHPTAGTFSFVGSPIHLSRTPVAYTHHPPEAGEHTEELLIKHGFTKLEIKKLRDLKII